MLAFALLASMAAQADDNRNAGTGFAGVVMYHQKCESISTKYGMVRLALAAYPQYEDEFNNAIRRLTRYASDNGERRLCAMLKPIIDNFAPGAK
jgi:hypothetical protein